MDGPGICGAGECGDGDGALAAGFASGIASDHCRGGGCVIPSLAQQLLSSRWRFVLSGSQRSSRSDSADWSQAVLDLLAQNELIWEDTDKKGRPRRRDVRDLLQGLRVLELVETSSGLSGCSAELELLAAVDSQGRSLKPAQVQLWLSQQLGLELSLSRVRRMELALLQC